MQKTKIDETMLNGVKAEDYSSMFSAPIKALSSAFYTGRNIYE